MSLNYNVFSLLSRLGLESNAVRENLKVIHISEDMATDMLYDEELSDISEVEITDRIANTSAQFHIRDVSNLLLVIISWLGINATIVSLTNLLIISGLASLNIILSVGIIVVLANILALLLIYQSVRLVVAGYFLGKLSSTNRLIIERMNHELGEEVTDVILERIIEWEDD